MDDTMKMIIEMNIKDIKFYTKQINWDNEMIALYIESLTKDFYNYTEKQDMARKLVKLYREREENEQSLQYYSNRLYENLNLKGGD